MGRCLSALILAIAGFGVACSQPVAPEAAINIVLVTLESLRTDHVGAYGGYSPMQPTIPVMPALDRFAAAATVYEDAHSVTSWTLASHASLFTGLYPSGHQTDGPMDRLDDSYSTLAEVLASHGYQTAGVISGPYLRGSYNLNQGFEIYDQESASVANVQGHRDVTNPRMEQALRRFLERDRDPERPFFLFAYFWDPHFDFLPPAPYDEMFAAPDAERIDLSSFDTNPAIHQNMSEQAKGWILAQYAGELRWTDEHLGRFFDLLRRLELWNDTLVIVTADHGEEFFDHGEKGHKNNLHAETVRVPLIVKYPGQREGRRDGRLVSLVDIAPTVFALAGVEVDQPLHGRSLLSPEDDPERAIFYELRQLQYYRGPEGERFSQGGRWGGVRQGDLKLIWFEKDAQTKRILKLYDVRQDPGETKLVSDAHPGRTQQLLQLFEDRMAKAREDASNYRRGGTVSLTPEEQRQLEALGYFER